LPILAPRTPKHKRQKSTEIPLDLYLDELGSPALRALIQLAQLGTMAAVAEELGYTPGAVSQQFARLEATVGTPLVTRVGREFG
jgi:hypothetical protein